MVSSEALLWQARAPVLDRRELLFLPASRSNTKAPLPPVLGTLLTQCTG